MNERELIILKLILVNMFYTVKGSIIRNMINFCFMKGTSNRLMGNRLKHDREIEIGEPTSKTLKKLRQEQLKRAIMGMCCFYRTATRYLTRHLPFANELLYDLAVFPLMLNEDHACQVIRIRTAKKLSQIIRQDYVG